MHSVSVSLVHHTLNKQLVANDLILDSVFNL